jgi:hypothetical protein
MCIRRVTGRLWAIHMARCPVRCKFTQRRLVRSKKKTHAPKLTNQHATMGSPGNSLGGVWHCFALLSMLITTILLIRLVWPLPDATSSVGAAKAGAYLVTINTTSAGLTSRNLARDGRGALADEVLRMFDVVDGGDPFDGPLDGPLDDGDEGDEGDNSTTSNLIPKQKRAASEHLATKAPADAGANAETQWAIGTWGYCTFASHATKATCVSLGVGGPIKIPGVTLPRCVAIRL